MKVQTYAATDIVDRLEAQGIDTSKALGSPTAIWMSHSIKELELAKLLDLHLVTFLTKPQIRR